MRLSEEYVRLQEDYNGLREDKSEAAAIARGRIRQVLKKMGHDEIHLDEERIAIDVPKAHDGRSYKINDQEFFGKVMVPACVAQQLLWMIDNNVRVDRDRLKESQYHYNLGPINAAVAS